MTAKILIVDDDQATRGGLTDLLAEAGYDTRAAASFSEARQALADEAPDLLISDLRLDGFNGLQLVALGPRPVPAIIVTGFHDEVLAREARRLGAEYLVKPVSPSALIDLVSRRLAVARPAASHEPTRRWTRKPLPRALDGRIDNRAARILDVSYGGVRFETGGFHGDDGLPPSVRLVLPSPPVAVDLNVVWAAPGGDRGWIFGAAVSDSADPAWRQLVDMVDLGV